MADITPMVFTPPTGYRDTTVYPTNPPDETTFRDGMQDIPDQLRDFVNATLVTAINQKANSAQEAWIAPTLLNSWVNYGAGFESAGYYKDTIGKVKIRGMIRSGTVTSGTVIFTLPVGYRPSAHVLCAVMCSSDGATIFPATIIVESTGNVIVNNVPYNVWLTINIPPFRAA